MSVVLYPEEVKLLARAVDEACSCIKIETGHCPSEVEARVARAIIDAHQSGNSGFQLLVAQGILAGTQSEPLPS